ncbi:MAG: fluoride efflux transporter CrcB [Legionellaceae bacterium]|nr:fluoride efflux transporter CrcB [Legionellaceae bacterium]
MNSWLIFLGAGLGGVFRYWISNGTYGLLGRNFPYGTLVVNATGCFLMGLLFVLILAKVDRDMAPALRSLFLIGFLGGYTTFSSFSIETLNLFEIGDWLNASLNIIASVFLCIVMTWFGMALGKSI